MDKKNNTIEYLKSFYIKDYLYMAFAIVIYSIGLTGFIMPNKVVTGGLAGAALLLNYATHIEVSTTIMVVNITLLVLAFRFLGKTFVINTVIGAGLLTLGVKIGETYLTPYFTANPLIHDTFITIVLGGILMGTGLGMVYSVNGSTGGVDIIGFLVTKYFKIRISRILLVVDLLVVTSSIFVLKGYVPMKYMNKLTNILTSKFPMDIQIQNVDENDTDAPVLLRNNGYSSPLETVIESYSLPSTEDVDPTIAVSLFYYFLLLLRLQIHCFWKEFQE